MCLFFFSFSSTLFAYRRAHAMSEKYARTTAIVLKWKFKHMRKTNWKQKAKAKSKAKKKKSKNQRRFAVCVCVSADARIVPSNSHVGNREWSTAHERVRPKIE